MRAAPPALVVLALTFAPACGDNASFQLPPSSAFAERCASPRAGVDPATGQAFPDIQGTVDDEKDWVRSWIDQYYLWYDEVPVASPSDYATAVDYFAELKTPDTTASGHPKDRFHFTYPTDVWESLSSSGIEPGYGVRWAVIVASPPREVVVAYTEPGSPGASALARGAQVIAVDGVPIVDGDPDPLNAGLSPAGDGESHTFEVQDVGATTTRTVTLVSAEITSTPVQNVGTLAGGQVGYIQFNDHILSAEDELSQAIAQLRDAGVTDLVLDMRYNGGGWLAIASELAYEIAGPSPTAGHAFESLTFNDKYPTTNPITGAPLTPTPFYDTSVLSSSPAPLPTLGLSRVFVLTGPNTCSASEAVINGLVGVGIQVIQIGSTTCGKPYGFYPQDNCGTTFFAIQFEGVNDQGFGDYADGFSTDGSTGATLPGCAVPDDFTHALGDPAEGRLAAALQYRADGSCPATSARRRAAAPLSAVDGYVPKPPWLENRLYRLPAPR